MIFTNSSTNLLHQIKHPVLHEKSISLFILRLDLIKSEWGGNKFFKLKYHFYDAVQKGFDAIGSYGGPWSNHLAALASFGHEHKIETHGRVKFNGDINLYPTLLHAKKNGMQLTFLSNQDYALLERKTETELDEKIYWIPNGGHTKLGIKGCEEILQLPCLQNKLPNFTHVVVPVGNGTTLAGISNSALPHQKIIGVVAIKNGGYLQQEINPFLLQENIEWDFENHFGGFAKTNFELDDFIKFSKVELNIPLDKVYTSKMMFSIWKKILNNQFKIGSSILAIHTGGLQGNGNTS